MLKIYTRSKKTFRFCLQKVDCKKIKKNPPNPWVGGRGGIFYFIFYFWFVGRWMKKGGVGVRGWAWVEGWLVGVGAFHVVGPSFPPDGKTPMGGCIGYWGGSKHVDLHVYKYMVIFIYI
jgi:hypothetical protein